MKCIPIILSCLLAGWAPAASINILTTDGTGGITGNIRRGPTYPPGSSESIGGTQFHVKNSGNGSTTRKAYARFDTSGLSFTAKHAVLRLTVSLIDTGIGGNDQTIYVYGITDESLDNWSTAGLNWTMPRPTTLAPHMKLI
jgi:hypothetical protein